MNDRYGVDPCAASTMLELASLLRHFGPEHGRFLFDFPIDWHTHVGDQFRGASDLERARLTELLRKAKRSLLPTKTQYSSSLPWTKNAEHLTGAKGRIGPAGSKLPCRPIVDVLTDPDAFPDCRGLHVPRTPAAYAEVARPLFQMSRKVVLIDRYFRLREQSNHSSATFRQERYFRPFKALIQAAKEERRVEVFKLMVSRKRVEIQDDKGATLTADLADLERQVGIKLEYAWLDEKNPLDLHPRYLLGNECGLKFDWGFDVSDAKLTNHVEWVGRAALEPLLRRFM